MKAKDNYVLGPVPWNTTEETMIDYKKPARLSFYEMTAVNKITIHPDAWTFNPKEDLISRGLQRFGLWLARLAGAKNQETTLQNIKVNTIEIDSLIEYVRKLEKQTWDHYHFSPHVLLIGPKDWQEVARTADPHIGELVISFEGREPGHWSFRGITVVVQSWYTGAPVVIPARLVTEYRMVSGTKTGRTYERTR